MQKPSRRGPSIAHIGIAVRGLADGVSFYRDILGLPESLVDFEDGADIVGLAAGPALIELLQARDPDSPVAKFITRRGPGMHHVCFAVDDLDETLERCRTAGIRLIDETPRRGAQDKRIAFLHPSSTAGVLVELTEY